MSSESSVIFGAFGCLFAIIVLTICASHSIFHYFRNNSQIHSSQKRTMWMELIMIVLFLLPTVSNTFLRNNYFHTDNDAEQHLSPIGCKIAMALTIPPYSMGKIILYSLFMYRICKTFEHSMFAVGKVTPYLLITLLSFIIIFFSVCYTVTILKNENHAVVQQVGDVLVCSLEYSDDHPMIKLLLFVLPIVNMLMELIVCVYLIYIFTSRLNKLRAALYAIEVSESIGSVGKVNSVSEIDSVANKSKSDVVLTNSDVAKGKLQSVMKLMTKSEAIDLKTIAVKQTVLGVSALTSSLMFYVYGMSMRSSGFMGWDIIINVLSIHLMFSYSQCIWNILCCKVNTKK